LTREDADAAAIVQRRFEKEGIRLLLGAEVLSVTRTEAGRVVRYRGAGGESEVTCDEILVSAGRRPNVEGLGLESAGIAYSERGLRVDDHLRTTNPRVFGVGDCCMHWQFTHAADAAAKIVVQNALFFGRKKLSTLVMPWCTYTDPEVAHVGLYEADARVRAIEPATYTVQLEKVNRGFCFVEYVVRVHTRKGSDVILGATIVATHAGEMISEVSLAITSGLGLGKIAAVIHPYPTQAEGIKAAANAYMRTKLTPTAKKVLGLLLRLQR
jgi:pyruvate/2-oxoglutarate dehydrogenase complex dihydrolipoamide dehydrogenase (E3) component